MPDNENSPNLKDPAGIRLTLGQVNGLLEHLMNVPVPYRYSEPIIRLLRDEMRKQNGA